MVPQVVVDSYSMGILKVRIIPYLSPFLCVSADQKFLYWPQEFFPPELSLLKLVDPQDWIQVAPFNQQSGAWCGWEKDLSRVTIIHSLTMEKTIDSLQTSNYYSCYTIMICNTAFRSYLILICFKILLVINKIFISYQPS